ncbi:hypothetical protein Q7M76_03395 [Candidatus Liberibacter asiaticus]|uniref:Uncharacterized protein n=2 Tax=Liberibacter asiaticus TaxID=34021 RepID=C6XF36_LIBAP|nr:hypothetical protein [Candidatus Liberibacter asiaticus]ACT56988.1 hypothetical protein CLIBASIA_02010 [Candidatus Liberibacter asiaticus str. psy62]AGH17046.1 hypothetical protein WSI_03380 [Candidatus Liberibacter asiaticus str. gxpsy]MCU7488709.1 hypothetical protein [Candidatus Liberibacter asiaticus]MCU7489744.1 hypothetical protein [Candidatus Liberibacter asiaticus]MDI1494209.1 hypothetical protein [Candidatus Liberibacter asiaticus]
MPTIHLLTVDSEIAENKAERIDKHNIILVVLDKVKKEKHLKE